MNGLIHLEDAAKVLGMEGGGMDVVVPVSMFAC